MIVYNTQNVGNPFGFELKSKGTTKRRIIQSSAIGGARSSRFQKNSSKKKLSVKNVTFLKSLGLRVKKQ